MGDALRSFLVCGVQRGPVNIGIGIIMFLVYSSLNMTDPVSHPYETTKKIIDLATSFLALYICKTFKSPTHKPVTYSSASGSTGMKMWPCWYIWGRD